MAQEIFDNSTYPMVGGDGPYIYARNSNYQVLICYVTVKFTCLILLDTKTGEHNV